jgi:uncharacterized membrane protein YccC
LPTSPKRAPAVVVLLPTDPTSLRLAARITIAAMAAYVVAAAVTLPESLWAVITALIVVQMSVGGTIGAGLDRMVGTLVGAAVGGLAATVHLIWHAPPVWLLLLLAIAPLSLFATRRPSYRVAPVTAALMLLIVHDATQPIAFAIDRVVEITIGCVIGITVSILVLPYHAEQQLVDRVASGLRVLADLVTALIGGSGSADPATVDRLNERIRALLTSCEASTTDVQRERRMHLGSPRDPEPLFRTLRRLRSDVAIIDRAAARLCASADGSSPSPDLAPLAAAIAGFLVQSADALHRHTAAPSLEPFDAAVAAYPFADTSANDALVSLSFAVAALRRDCGDLAERMAERTADRTGGASA